MPLLWLMAHKESTVERPSFKCPPCHSFGVFAGPFPLTGFEKSVADCGCCHLAWCHQRLHLAMQGGDTWGPGAFASMYLCSKFVPLPRAAETD